MMNNEAIFDGRSLTTGVRGIADGEDVVALLESSLSGESSRFPSRFPSHDTWFAPGVPALARGAVRIVPLAWRPPNAVTGPVNDATPIWRQVQGACEYRRGPQIGIDLRSIDSDNGYIRSLVAIGAHRADWWEFGDVPHEAAIVLVCSHHPDGSDSVAIHVTPIEWLRWRLTTSRSMPIAVPVTDLSWSWTDVVELHRATFGTTTPDGNA